MAEINRNRLRRWLEIAGMTQRELALLIETRTHRPCSERTVRAWLAEPELPSARPCPDWVPEILTKNGRRQRGFTYIHMAVGVAGAAVIGAAIVGSAANFLKGNAGLEKSARAGQQMNAMAVAIRNALADSDADGAMEAPVYTSLGTKPADGGNLPQNLGLALSDPWGTYYGYCSWDNGTTNASANRNSGDNPQNQNSPLFAIISAGPDGAFNTTCANVKAGSVGGDDLYRVVLQAAGSSGTSGALYFGEAVADISSLNTASLRTGEMRMETSSGNLKRWDGATWQTVSGAAGASGGYWQGSVMNIADLPATPMGENEGTVIWVTAENRPYIWTSVFGWRAVADPPWTGTGNSPRQTLWSWGRNNYGQLGQGNTTNLSVPVRVGALTNWKQVAGGQTHSIAIKTDGTLWTWGRNNAGQLGLNDTSDRSSPTQVGVLTNWKQASGGGQEDTLAIQTDGTLWAWGRNDAGQLGLGNTTYYSAPMKVGALTTWKQVSIYYYWSSAIQTDGSLWTWGRNESGQLGQSDKVNRSSPTQVGALTDWKQASAGYKHGMVVKTDGTLWTWGSNTSFQMGVSDMTSRSSPVLVNALTTWKKVSAGLFETGAIQTDGSLWAWGLNSMGQVGAGDAFPHVVPTQIGALTNWKQVLVGYDTVAVKTDGTLWTWGDNTYGQLGDGTTNRHSSPVQVGGQFNWKQVAAGVYHMLAIQSDY